MSRKESAYKAIGVGLVVLAIALALGAFGCGRYQIKETYQEPLYYETNSTGDHWEAGVAKRVITPTDEVYLAGYGRNRKSKGVHDDLYARCLVLSNGKTSVGIVSLDLIGMLGSDVMAIKRGVHTLRPEHIIVSFTHTHSGPDTTGIWGKGLGSGRDERYIKRVNGEAAACLEEAGRSRESIRLFFASAQVQLSEFDNDTADKPDQVFTVMRGTTTNGKNLFTLINYAVHPHVINNRFVSADILASFYTRTEELGGGMGIFLNGAQGNVGPAIEHHDNDWNAIDLYGNMLTAEAFRTSEALSGDYPLPRLLRQPQLIAPEIESRDHTVTIRRAVIHTPLKNFFFKLAVWLGAVPDLRDREGNVPLELMYLRIGEAEMATIPGEAFPNIAKDLREKMNAPYEFICGLCNGAYGYIMYRHEHEGYHYHRRMSVGPIGEKIYQGLAELIDKKNALNSSLP